VEEQGKALPLPILLGDQHFGHGARAEQVLAQRGLVEADGMAELFVVGQITDQLRDQRQVCRRGRPDSTGHGAPTSASTAIQMVIAAPPSEAWP
jgi:hypothetical protein